MSATEYTEQALREMTQRGIGPCPSCGEPTAAGHLCILCCTTRRAGRAGRDNAVAQIARRVVDRVFSVYKDEYIAHCIATDPDSLLALVAKLDSALAGAAESVHTVSRSESAQSVDAVSGAPQSSSE